MPSVITGSQISSATGVMTALSTGAVGTAGSVTGAWTLTTGSTWQATFADLAEHHESDQAYAPGTILVFGGDKEVTASTQFNDTRVAGVVSTNPAYIMNVGCPGTTVLLALQGRVPCNVIGRVSKGDILVTSNVQGYAIVNNDPKPGTIIGKALESKADDDRGSIQVAVGRT
jgi:hypothetical protein